MCGESCRYVCVTYTPEENARLYPTRQKVVNNVFWLSHTVLVLSIVNIVMGVLTVVFQDDQKFPVTSGGQFWVGGMMFGYGVCGVGFSRVASDLKGDITSRTRSWFGATYWNTCSGISACLCVLVWVIIAVVRCAENSCDNDGDIVLISQCISLVLILVYAVAVAYTMFAFNRYRRAFQIVCRSEAESLDYCQIRGEGNHQIQEKPAVY